MCTLSEKAALRTKARTPGSTTAGPGRLSIQRKGRSTSRRLRQTQTGAHRLAVNTKQKMTASRAMCCKYTTCTRPAWRLSKKRTAPESRDLRLRPRDRLLRCLVPGSFWIEQMPVFDHELRARELLELPSLTRTRQALARQPGPGRPGPFVYQQHVGVLKP